MGKLNEQGWEVPDQTPVAVPAYIKKWDQRDTIREMIRQQLSKEAEDAGFESWEEADDFDIGDDYDPTSPYEECFDPETGVSSFDSVAPYEDATNPDKGPSGDAPSGEIDGAANTDPVAPSGA